MVGYGDRTRIQQKVYFRINEEEGEEEEEVLSNDRHDFRS